MVTGGIAPNSAGTVYIGGSKMTNKREAEEHRIVTQTVHENGSKIGQQLPNYYISPSSYTPYAIYNINIILMYSYANTACWKVCLSLLPCQCLSCEVAYWVGSSA